MSTKSERVKQTIERAFNSAGDLIKDGVLKRKQNTAYVPGVGASESFVSYPVKVLFQSIGKASSNYLKNRVVAANEQYALVYSAQIVVKQNDEIVVSGETHTVILVDTADVGVGVLFDVIIV